MNFSAVISQTPAAFGLTASDATAIRGSVQTFDQALAVVLRPTGRTAPRVAAKDAVRATMLKTLRHYAGRIGGKRGVSNASRIELGLNIPKGGRSRIAAPQSNPLLSVIGATPGVQMIRFADANTPARRAKPLGVAAMQLFLKIGPAAVSDPRKAAFYSDVTRQPFAVEFKAADDGKTATYFGRLITRTGAIGPWSAPRQRGDCRLGLRISDFCSLTSDL